MLSGESDYIGQQLHASVDRDLNNSQLNISVGASYGWDDIEPVQDDDTNTAPDSKNTAHFNVVATQVVTATTLVRMGVEYNIVNGLQHNPYRNVYAGGTYLPEHHPDSRQRRDAFVKLNQYLSQRSSLKLSYRFYNDSWGIDSHELGPTLSQYVTDGASMRFQYRWYTQTAAHEGISGRWGSGQTALVHRWRTLPGVSAPSSVVRSIIDVARRMPSRLAEVLIERRPSAAARSSTPTRLTGVRERLMTLQSGRLPA